MTITAAGTEQSLAGAIAQRRWLRRSQPFPYFLAYDVFSPAVYARIEADFRKILDSAAGKPYLENHDIHGTTIVNDQADELWPLLSRPFHDLLARLMDVPATGHVTCGLHHHRIGSAHGFPHNDLNPGWFDGEPSSDSVQLARPEVVDYTTGTTSRRDARPVETIRAASLLFYLANPRWEPGDGGTTGLYTSANDEIEHPVAAIPPINNSMLFFECTPDSYHGFISNRRSPRNSIVMWLHRPKADVVARWGEDAIVPYGLIPHRKGPKR